MRVYNYISSNLYKVFLWLLLTSTVILNNGCQSGDSNIIDYLIFDNTTIPDILISNKDACNLPDMHLLLDSDGSVLYNSSETIAAFQFDVPGSTIDNASGGEAEDAGFLISVDGEFVVGYSNSGATFGPGCGTLVILEGLGDDAIELSGIIISNPEGIAIPFEHYSPVFYDNFSNSLLWQTSTNGMFQIKNGKLRISSGSDYSYSHMAYIDLADISSYSYVAPKISYTVDVDFISGSRVVAYGIGIRDQHETKYYYFITSEGKYSFHKLSSNSAEWIKLIEWRSNLFIENADGDGKLNLSYENNMFELNFNNQKLDSYEATNKTFDLIYLYQQDSTVIDFDNVKLYGTLLY